MPNVGVKLHIGGINVNASTRGGVDTAGMANQGRSPRSWYAVAGILVILIVGGVGLYVKHAISQSLHGLPGGATAAAKWDGKTPFSCGGNDERDDHRRGRRTSRAPW